ncbi:hypothetical protein ACFU3E_38300 [Streptomyces sp. NPDC057424]
MDRRCFLPPAAALTAGAASLPRTALLHKIPDYRVNGDGVSPNGPGRA